MLSYACKTGWTRKKLNSDRDKEYIYKTLIFESRCLCLVSISSEKFEFYEYEMYLDVKVVGST